MKVKIVANAKNFSFEKVYNLSAVPAKNWTIDVFPEGLGYAMLKPFSISQDIERDLVVVHCQADLDDLWVLHKAGWAFCGDNTALWSFEQDKAVQKAVAERDARMAKARAEN